MKERIIAFHYNGDTHSQGAPQDVETSTVDTNKQRQYDVSMDRDGSHWSLDYEWELRSVTLPEWMATREFCNITFNIGVYWMLAYGATLEWPESWFRSLMKLSRDTRFAAVQLLASNPARMRSPFRINLREKVIAWCEQDPASRQYQSPLSPKQIAAVMGPYGYLTMKRIDESTYHASRYHTWGVALPREAKATISAGASA